MLSCALVEYPEGPSSGWPECLQLTTERQEAVTRYLKVYGFF